MQRRSQLCKSDSSHQHHTTPLLHIRGYKPLFLCSLYCTALQDRFLIWGVSFPDGITYLKYSTTNCGRKSCTLHSHSLTMNNGELSLLTNPLPGFPGPLSFTTRESLWTLHTVLTLQCIMCLHYLHASQYTQAMNLGKLQVLIP